MFLRCACILLSAVCGLFGQAKLSSQGAARLDTSPVPMGGQTTTTMTGTPFSPFAAVFDIPPGYYVIGGLGSIYLGLTQSLVIALDGFANGYPVFGANGQISFTAPVAVVPAYDGALAYGQIIAFDPALPNHIAVSNAKSIQFTYPNSYHPTLGNLSLARAFHQTARLPNGAYLVIGGGNGALLLPVASPTCEIYNPYLRVFQPAPSMTTERTLHRATALNDGRILVTGGSMTLGVPISTAEIYNPATGQWSAPIPMNSVRIAHTATKLNDGRVLITGGSSSFVLNPPTSTNYLPIFQSAMDTAEIFDPATNTFTPTVNAMSAKRFGHAATVLANGQVLIAGGVRGGQTILGTGAPLYAATADLFNPATNSFTQVPGLAIGRVVHTLSTLSNGTAIAIGGAGGTLVTSIGSSEIFNPATNTWSSGPALPSSQTLGLHQAIALPNGDLYIAGGAVGAVGLFQGVSVSYTYNSASGYTVRASLPAARQAHTLDWTPEGALLIGGADQGNASAQPPISAQAVATAIYWTPN